jgi:hypothetical protein
MLHKSEHPSPIIDNIQKRPECPLLAQSGLHDTLNQCPFFGGKADIAAKLLTRDKVRGIS